MFDARKDLAPIEDRIDSASTTGLTEWLEENKMRSIREKRRRLHEKRTEFQIEETEIKLDQIREQRRQIRASGNLSASGMPVSTGEKKENPLAFIEDAIKIGMIPKPLDPGITDATDQELLLSYLAKDVIHGFIGTNAREKNLDVSGRIEHLRLATELGYMWTLREIQAYNRLQSSELVKKIRREYTDQVADNLILGSGVVSAGNASQHQSQIDGSANPSQEDSLRVNTSYKRAQVHEELGEWVKDNDGSEYIPRKALPEDVSKYIEEKVVLHDGKYEWTLGDFQYLVDANVIRRRKR